VIESHENHDQTKSDHHRVCWRAGQLNRTNRMKNKIKHIAIPMLAIATGSLVGCAS
jgi:hypothetical protein